MGKQGNLFGVPGVWERVIADVDLAWPDEDVVRCVQRFYGKLSPEERAQKHALDIGFGSGRHLVYLGTQGFQVAGIDVAESAMNWAHQKLSAAGLQADIRAEELSQTAFDDHAFDLIVAWGVLFLKADEHIKADLKKVHNLLKPGGILCANFRTLNNWFYGLGEPQGEHAYLLDDRAEDYQGIYYRFFSKAELRQFLEEAGFEVVYLEYKEWHKFGDKVHSWWLATLRAGQ
jgi:2-polyprenyl-3-methyl-5-hydroxy-6-metoxy-1,4-benzoquinol methylase